MTTKIRNIDSIYEVTFSPTVIQLAEIEKWLIDEVIDTKGGFYCNWKIIKTSFTNNELATISLNNKTVGFVIWSITSEKTARIEIAEVKPSFRNIGIGKKLIDQLTVYFNEKNIYVIDLQCAPAESETIWKRLGFVKMSDPSEKFKLSIEDNKKLYKILSDHLQQSSFLQNDETIELWNNEPYKTKDLPPTYIWNLEFEIGTRRLSKPIIQLASYEWRIRWTKNGLVIKDDKVKRFAKEIDFGSFIIIKEL